MKILKLIILILFILSLVVLAYSEILKIELVAIIAALVLGIAGLFQDWIKSHFYYPEINVDFNIIQPDCHKTKIDFKNSEGKIVATSDCYYYRLKISNKGNIRAQKIEVIILEKYFQNNNKFIKDKDFLPMNLKWSHDGVVIRESIAPSLFRYCDFGCIVHPEYQDLHLGRFSEIGINNKVVMCLDLEVYPNTGSHLIVPGRYRFRVIITADNGKISSKTFEVEFNDFWSDDEKIMLGKGLKVKEVKGLS